MKKYVRRDDIQELVFRWLSWVEYKWRVDGFIFCILVFFFFLKRSLIMIEPGCFRARDFPRCSRRETSTERERKVGWYQFVDCGTSSDSRLFYSALFWTYYSQPPTLGVTFLSRWWPSFDKTTLTKRTDTPSTQGRLRSMASAFHPGLTQSFTAARVTHVKIWGHLSGGAI